ncbi:hypothetical protein ILUMI_10359 [Ignelater luminosus]|uniref:Uncharacterized protein n=1 Tax=Ignelater luminosus TaxID=2038154 RepID=A0A8K0GE84_IGNLU|nr:hypothetical protein ILUMI_10359 [Ignelater luminosus]
MPRSTTSKKLDKVDAVAVENAANEEVVRRMTKKEASIHFKVSRTTLARNLKKNSDAVEFSNPMKKVFTDQQEKELLNYVIRAFQWCFGVRVGETRLPPEQASLGRMTSFNKFNVELFFNTLSEVYEKLELSPYRIWKLDETACSTVHTPPRNLVSKNNKQVSAANSTERSFNMTVSFIPPALIFPRVHFKEHMLNAVAVAGPSHGDDKVTPEQLRRGGRTGKYRITTDTPEKEELEMAQQKPVKMPLVFSELSSLMNEQNLNKNPKFQGRESEPEGLIVCILVLGLFRYPLVPLWAKSADDWSSEVDAFLLLVPPDWISRRIMVGLRHSSSNGSWQQWMLR